MLSVLADTSQGIEEDSQELRLGVLQEKWRHDVEQVNFLNQASAARASAKNAKTAGWIGGFTSLLGMGAKMVGGIPAGTPGSAGGVSIASRYSSLIHPDRRVRRGFGW